MRSRFRREAHFLYQYILLAPRNATSLTFDRWLTNSKLQINIGRVWGLLAIYDCLAKYITIA